MNRRLDGPAPAVALAAGLLCLALMGTGVAEAQVTPVPVDLTIHVEAGSLGPSHDLYIFDLDATGAGTFCLVPPENRETADCSTLTQHQLAADEVAGIWAQVQAGDFFNLAPSHIADVVDGTFAELEITANGVTHTVLTQNLELPAVDDIVLAIDAALPAGSKIIYNAIFDRV